MAETEALKDKLVVLFGGSGFLGHYLAQTLLKRGARLRIASRNPERSHSLKPLANLGQIQFVRCNINDPDQVRAVATHADAVVNLVGSFAGDQIQLMGNSAGVVAQAAADAGAKALVHISAIGANPDSSATYGQANALGEKLVSQAFPKATILRPSALFGEDDNFVNMFAGLIQMLPVLPVFGPDSELQPAFVDDLAEAIAVALADPGKHGGKVYELGGPEVMTMLELNKRIAAAARRDPLFLPVPDPISAIFAALPATPINGDQWSLLKEGNVVSGKHPGFEKLGIEPHPLGLFLDRWMTRYRKHGRFSTSSTPT
ncbi:complex I NDUFA9 subunit family protein [Altererythrobacter sp. MF3-039]|uniref:complex I NDUFA9 subunit family protein n=1 Tax=Altererythrobacter sp. MF3-039 TaxID=3252901 RepID=UPI00390CA1A3